MTRVDAMLRELSARHRNQDPRFLAAVRPLIERIVDPAMGVEHRIGLMEMLAETFERDVAIRRDAAAARAHLERFFARLRQLLGFE